MILLCGIPTEPPIAKVVNRLESLEVHYVLFNQRDVLTSNLSWKLVDGVIDGELSCGGKNVSLKSISGVYIRLMDDTRLPELEDEPEDSVRLQASRKLHRSLVNWIDVAPARVVNRFRHQGSNGSKPYQSQHVRCAGFSIPETLVTNDLNAVREFEKTHKRIVYKSVSGVRSIVAEMSPDEWSRIDDIRACPVQFQAYVSGFDVRVHTVGSQVFATRIDSPGTDYRYADHGENGTKLTPFNLPRELERRCLKLADSLNLPFAGIDLRFTPNGDVVCFEVNPSPAYSYYEAHTDQPISLALAQYLAGLSD